MGPIWKYESPKSAYKWRSTEATNIKKKRNLEWLFFKLVKKQKSVPDRQNLYLRSYFAVPHGLSCMQRYISWLTIKSLISEYFSLMLYQCKDTEDIQPRGLWKPHPPVYIVSGNQFVSVWLSMVVLYRKLSMLISRSGLRSTKPKRCYSWNDKSRHY